MDAHTQLELWHLFVGALITGITVIGAVWRTWIVPAQRKEVERAKWEARVDERLSHGDTKFDEVLAEIKSLRAEIKADHRCVEERLRKMETAFAGAVFRGVGDAR